MGGGKTKKYKCWFLFVLTLYNTYCMFFGKNMKNKCVQGMFLSSGRCFFIPLMGFGMFYFPLGMNFGRDMIESRNDCFIIKISLEKK